MILIEVPGSELLRLEHIVLDFNGTLAKDGNLIKGTVLRLNSIARKAEVHVVTADTFGTADDQLRNVMCALHKVSGPDQDMQKGEFIRKLGSDQTATIGNGMNDRRMLEMSRLGICIIGSEGASTQAIEAADICVWDIRDALDLFLKPERIKATLRLS